ncbi:MAG: four-helix bundle copper-binding protein [Bacteroidota bacterium]|nr:four-helix bundle copper-binding protein [Bacteroidota bacterium]
MKNQNTQLLAVLAECAAACNTCSTACLDEKDVKMMANCIKLDMDCAQICAITAAFVARNSDHATHLMKECAEICGKCATECEKHEMAHCRACAEACRKCEEACKSSK